MHQEDVYKVIVFWEVGAAPTVVGSGVARPLALLMRLGSGRLIEIDLGLANEALRRPKATAVSFPRPVPP